MGLALQGGPVGWGRGRALMQRGAERLIFRFCGIVRRQSRLYQPGDVKKGATAFKKKLHCGLIGRIHDHAAPPP